MKIILEYSEINNQAKPKLFLSIVITFNGNLIAIHTRTHAQRIVLYHRLSIYPRICKIWLFLTTRFRVQLFRGLDLFFLCICEPIVKKN